MKIMDGKEYGALRAAAGELQGQSRVRAYSVLEVKSINDDERIIEGIATTPSPDRVGDVVEPKGAEFDLPIPLLWQHRSDSPVGNVVEAKVTTNGIKIKAQFAQVSEPASLKDELDQAWAKVKAGLVRGLSIGFMPLESSRIEDTFSERFIRWEWLELSCVTIPMNSDATIQSIKSADSEHLRAAPGKDARAPGKRSSPTAGASAKTTHQSKGLKAMPTIKEHIVQLENSRASKAARMEEVLLATVEKGETTDEATSQEVETLKGDISSIDKSLQQFRDLEAINVGKASVVDASPTAQQPSRPTPAGGGIVSVSRNLPKGTAFTRYVQCLALSKGDLMYAARLAKRYQDSTPEVGNALELAADLGTSAIMKNAVSVGTTAGSTWAAPFVQYQDMAQEFVELLRPQTILGRIQGLRQVPFNIRVPRTTSGATGGWVGENTPKPVSSMAFDSITLGFSKVAVIVALTEELVRFSNPAAEAVVRQELIDALTQLIDVSFIDPNRAAVANVSPASITNGATLTNATGVTVATVTANIQALFQQFATNNLSLDGAVWIMNPRTALGLSMLRTAQDIFAFPTITMQGGTFMGLPVVVSGNVPISSVSTNETIAVLLKPSEVYLADDGGVEIDVSREASVQMSDAPSAGATSLVSFWQNNLVGLRAEQFINWRRRRDAAVQVWDGVRL